MKRKELEAKTKTELLALARRIDLPGRSQMSKDELVAALVRRRIPPQRATRATGRTAAKKPAVRAAARPAKKKAAAKKPAARAAAPPAKKKAAGVKAPARKTPKAKPAARKPKALAAPAARRATAETAAAPPAAPLPGPAAPHLPDRYGEDYAGLMVRDPYWLHVYWEVTPETLAATRRALGSEGPQGRLVLRVHNYPPDTDVADLSEGTAAGYDDIDLPEDAASWYVQVARPAQLYGAAIGLRTPSGAFRACVSSNIVHTPRGGCSAETEENWTAREDLFARLAGMLENGGVPGSAPALGLPPYQRPGGQTAARPERKPAPARPRRRKRS